MYSDVFCKVYNELGWNYYPEAFGENLLKWIDRTGAKSDACLDLACGTGVLCRILWQGGREVWGMDMSPGMIELAREKNPAIHYDVADMVSYRPGKRFDIVTCTGDSLNHIIAREDLMQVFCNVCDCLQPEGWFLFDLLNEREISTSEPFEFDFDEHTRVWFQMIRAEDRLVQLKIRVYEDGMFCFEQIITERIYEPEDVCRMLREIGFRQVRCADRLLEDDCPGTTWYILARK